MYRLLFKISFFLVCFISKGQENKLLEKLDSINGGDKQMEYILEIQAKLKETNEISILKDKLQSDFNTISSCIIPYVYNENLLKNEKKELEKQIRNIASFFYESNYYVLLKTSGGDGPMIGVDLKEIKNKKVVIVLLGGDCIIDDEDLLYEKIISFFNDKMNMLLNAE